MAPALLTSGPDALLGGRPWALEEDNASLASTHPMPVVPLSCDSQKRLRTLSGVGCWMGAKLRPPESHCPECTHLVMNPSAPPVWQVGKADLDWMNPLGQLGLQHCGGGLGAERSSRAGSSGAAQQPPRPRGATRPTSRRRIPSRGGGHPAPRPSLPPRGQPWVGPLAGRAGL